MTTNYADPVGPIWRLGALKLVLQWKGGILQLIWIEMLLATIAAVVVMALWLRQFVEARQVSDFIEQTAIFAYALDILTKRFQAALGMMLGFYTSIMYNRWWRVRNIENDVMSGIKSVSIYVSSFINSKTVEEQAATGLTKDELVSTLIRWVNLGHAIAVGEFYDKQYNIFSNLDTLVEMGLMTDRELECIIESPAKYDLPFRWFCDLLDKVPRSDTHSLPVPPALGVVNGQVTRTRSALDNLHMYHEEPVPLAYRQLVNITVRFYVFVLIINEGISALSLTADETTNLASVFWMTLPFVFEYFLFVGWLTLADALANPFRHWSDEFGWTDYVRRTYIASFSLIQNPLSSPLASASNLKKAEKNLAAKRMETMQEWIHEMASSGHDSCMMTMTGFDKSTKRYM